MKSILILLLIMASVFTAPAEVDFRQILASPTPFLTKIEDQIKSKAQNDSTDKALATDLQTLAYAINQEIIAADSPTWLNPSPERKEVIAKWAERLAPHTQSLVNLAFGDGFATSEAAKQSRSVLDFAPATPAFGEQVRPFLEHSPLVAYAAADLLYEHRLLTAPDRRALLNLMPKSEDQDAIQRWASELSSLDMVEVIPVAKLRLQTPPPIGEPRSVLNHYWSSLKVAQNLGPLANSILPDLEAIIGKLAPQGRGLVEKFVYARDVVNGKQARQGRVAKNGSGPLSPWLLTATPPQPEANPVPDRRITSTKAPDFQSAPKSLGEEPSSSTPWGIIVMLTMVGLGLLWLLLKRRS